MIVLPLVVLQTKMFGEEGEEPRGRSVIRKEVRAL